MKRLSSTLPICGSNAGGPDSERHFGPINLKTVCLEARAPGSCETTADGSVCVHRVECGVCGHTHIHTHTSCSPSQPRDGGREDRPGSGCSVPSVGPRQASGHLLPMSAVLACSSRCGKTSQKGRLKSQPVFLSQWRLDSRIQVCAGLGPPETSW